MENSTNNCRVNRGNTFTLMCLRSRSFEENFKVCLKISLRTSYHEMG